jgi:hypothetical protein
MHRDYCDGGGDREHLPHGDLYHGLEELSFGDHCDCLYLCLVPLLDLDHLYDDTAAPAGHIHHDFFEEFGWWN